MFQLPRASLNPCREGKVVCKESLNMGLSIYHEPTLAVAVAVASYLQLLAMVAAVLHLLLVDRYQHMITTRFM